MAEPQDLTPAASDLSRTSLQRRTDLALEYIDERHGPVEQDEVRDLIAGTRRRVLTAWEVFLSRRRTDSSRQTTRRHGRAAASELFPVAVINKDGQVEQMRIEPEFAPWVALALPSALVHLSAYRASLETRIELHRAGKDDPIAIGVSAAAARIAVVRGIVRALWQLEAIDRERMERLNEAIPSMGTGKIGIPSVRPSVELGDLQLLVRDSERQANHPAKGESSRSGLMDLAGLVFLTLGCRGLEVCGVRWDDSTTVAGGRAYVIRGKSRKDRLVYLNGHQAKTLDRWRASCDKPTGKHILRRLSKSGRLLDDGTDAISTRALDARMRKRAEKAAVDLDGLHSFRRWRATTELQAGEPITRVAARLGHSDVRTTQQYDSTDAESDAAAARRIAARMFRSERSRSA